MRPSLVTGGRGPSPADHRHDHQGFPSPTRPFCRSWAAVLARPAARIAADLPSLTARCGLRAVPNGGVALACDQHETILWQLTSQRRATRLVLLGPHGGSKREMAAYRLVDTATSTGSNLGTRGSRDPCAYLGRNASTVRCWLPDPRCKNAAHSVVPILIVRGADASTPSIRATTRGASSSSTTPQQ